MTARATHTHTIHSTSSTHTSSKGKENERQSLNEIVWSIKKKCGNTERFENDKREQKTTGTFDEKKTFFLHEQRKRKITEKKK